MTAFYPRGTQVTIRTGTHAGHDLAGMTGKVDGHFDMTATASDITHRVWLDKPFFVPDGKPNPVLYGPQGPTERKIHGEHMPDLRIDYVEVPASCLEA